MKIVINTSGRLEALEAIHEGFIQEFLSTLWSILCDEWESFPSSFITAESAPGQWTPFRISEDEEDWDYCDLMDVSRAGNQAFAYCLAATGLDCTL